MDYRCRQAAVVPATSVPSTPGSPSVLHRQDADAGFPGRGPHLWFHLFLM